MRIQHKRRSNEQGDASFLFILKKSLIFIPLFFLIGLIICVISALIFFKSADPTSKIRIASLISLYGSAFICSLIFTKRIGERNILAAIVYSLLLFILVYIISLILNTGNGILFKLGIIGVSVVAGLITRKKATKKIKRKKLR